MALHMMACNIKGMAALLGVPGLLRTIQSCAGSHDPQKVSPLVAGAQGTLGEGETNWRPWSPGAAPKPQVTQLTRPVSNSLGPKLPLSLTFRCAATFTEAAARRLQQQNLGE